MPGASVPLETIQEPKEGVAPDPPAGQTEVVTKEAGAARLRKMLIGVEDGPVASGDDKALDKHTFGTLKIVKQATALLNISTNAAVHAACGPLDDQEGRAFLAADYMGIQLVRGKDYVGNSR